MTTQSPIIKAVMTCKDLGAAPKTFRWEDYTTEPKMDGVRIYAVITAGEAHLYTRSHREVTAKLPHLREAMEFWSCVFPQIDNERVILDGELVYYNAETGEVDFTKAMNVISGPLHEHAIAVQRDNNQWLTLMVFDCLEAGGGPITGLDLEFRRKRVETIVRMLDEPCIVQMPWIDSASPETIEEMTQRFGEGAVLKRRGSPYEMKRSGLWLKAKKEATADVVPMGAIMANPGKFDGMIGALEFGQYKECRECWGRGRIIGITCEVCSGGRHVLSYRGKCSGMDDATRRYITDNLEAILNRRDVFEIKHNGTFESGLFRHPNFLRWREDKDALDCSWDDSSITVAKK